MFFYEVRRFGTWQPRSSDDKPKTQTVTDTERLKTSEGASWPIRDIIEIPDGWEGKQLDELARRKREMRELEREKRDALRSRAPAA